MKNTRRRLLTAGAALAPLLMIRRALALGDLEKGIHRIRGDVRVNGQPAKEGMEIKAGDVITTGAGSEVIFVTGKDAFLIRANSRVEAQGASVGSLVLSGLRIVTGAVLSVFTPGQPKTLRTATATIGIRGTAVYIEVEANRTYVCTCYGEVDLASAGDPAARETIRTRHHEQPRYVMAMGSPQMLMSAPVVNHTDVELEMLEALVGRRPPFAELPNHMRSRY